MENEFLYKCILQWPFSCSIQSSHNPEEYFVFFSVALVPVIGSWDDSLKLLYPVPLQSPTIILSFLYLFFFLKRTSFIFVFNLLNVTWQENIGGRLQKNAARNLTLFCLQTKMLPMKKFGGRWYIYFSS